MNIQQVILYSLGFMTAVFGVYLIGIGVLGLTKRRPLLFPSLYYTSFVLSIFLLGLALSFVVFFSSQRVKSPFLNVAPFVLLVLIALTVFSSRRQMSGYMILGIYDNTFRDAITYALRKLNLPYQENISRIRLINLNEDLEAQVVSSTGFAQIHIKQSKHSHHFKNIADTMSNYYIHKSVKVNYVPFVSCVILGICLIIIVSVRAFF